MSAERGDREVDELRELMAAHSLLPPVASQPDESEQAARLLRRVLAGSVPPRRRAPVGVAAVLVLLLGLGAAYALTRTAPPAAADAPRALRYSVASPADLAKAPSATSALRAVARAADALPAASQSGAVQYVADYGWLLAVDVTATATTRTIFPTMTQRWTAPDGSARVDQSRAGALNLDGTVRTDAPVEAENHASDLVGPGTVDAGLAGRLPLETDALRTSLLGRYGSLPCADSDAWTTQCLLTAIQDIYSQYVVPPALRAGLWRVLADEPGVKDLGVTDDRLGRRVQAVAIPAPDDPATSVVTVLLIDPGPGALLGTETVTVDDARPDAPQSTVTAFTSLTTSTWVDAVGDQHEEDDDD